MLTPFSDDETSNCLAKKKFEAFDIAADRFFYLFFFNSLFFSFLSVTACATEVAALKLES